MALVQWKTEGFPLEVCLSKQIPRLGYRVLGAEKGLRTIQDTVNRETQH